MKDFKHTTKSKVSHCEHAYTHYQEPPTHTGFITYLSTNPSTLDFIKFYFKWRISKICKNRIVYWTSMSPLSSFGCYPLSAILSYLYPSHHLHFHTHWMILKETPNITWFHLFSVCISTKLRILFKSITTLPLISKKKKPLRIPN